MKKLIRILAVILSFVFVLGLTSCGEESSEPKKDKEGNTVVYVSFHVDSSSTEGMAYKKRVDAFNRQYKEQKIKISASFDARTSGAEGYETKLIADKNAGDLADIITFDAPNCARYADSNILYDITNLVDNETKNDFLSLNEYQGKLYGLPIQESSAGFFYNKRIFADAGIDVSMYTVDNPWTFTQFKDVCQRLKNRLGDNKAVYLRLDNTTDEMATYLLYPIIYANGGQFLSNDGLTATGYFNSSKSIAGFQFIRDLIDAKYTSNATKEEGFYKGEVGMLLSSGWTIPDLDNKYKENFPDRNSWGILPYPQGEQKASATGSWCYGVTDNGVEDKTATMLAFNFLTSAESAVEITNATGMIPARKSVENNYQNGSPEKVLLEQLAKTGKARPATICYPEFSAQFGRTINELCVNSNVQEVVNQRTNGLQNDINLKK